MSTHQSYNLQDLIGHLKTLTPPLHFDIEPTEETLLINLRPEGELSYTDGDEELTVQVLTNLKIGVRTDRCNMYMVTDIDGRGTRWSVLSGSGTVVSTGYSTDPNHGS